MCRRDAVYTQVSHVVSIVVLALRLNATKSAVGISLKTQELYLIVFVARYADLFSHFYSFASRPTSPRKSSPSRSTSATTSKNTHGITHS